MLTLFTTPVVYLYLDRFSIWCRALWQRRGRENLTAAPGD
jgi:multidrug efflux pump